MILNFNKIFKIDQKILKVKKVSKNFKKHFKLSINQIQVKISLKNFISWFHFSYLRPPLRLIRNFSRFQHALHLHPKIIFLCKKSRLIWNHFLLVSRIEKRLKNLRMCLCAYEWINLWHHTTLYSKREKSNMESKMDKRDFLGHFSSNSELHVFIENSLVYSTSNPSHSW